MLIVGKTELSPDITNGNIVHMYYVPHRAQIQSEMQKKNDLIKIFLYVP